jgi:hypothetical protein
VLESHSTILLDPQPHAQAAIRIVRQKTTERGHQQGLPLESGMAGRAGSALSSLTTGILEKKPMAKSIEVRFWSKVTLGEGCWEWAAGCSRAGYGSIGINTGKTWKIVNSHRWMWEFVHGPIPDNLCVLHKCDNRKCVRPDHLFLGDRLDNANDMLAKGRKAVFKGATNGRAKLTENDVLAIRAAYTPRKGGALARFYGVTRTQISSVVTRKAWRHI